MGVFAVRMPVACSHKSMVEQDYGQFIQRMRKIRGYTQEQLAEAAGCSTSTVVKLEASGESLSIRPTNLDAILTAMAMRAFLGGPEIQVLVEATGRRFESIEQINDRAEQLRRAALAGPSPRTSHTPTDEERIDRAVHMIIAAGQIESLLVQLEALASLHSQQAADHERTPRPKRRLRVRRSLRREGTMDIEDIAHYPIDDDDQAGHDDANGGTIDQTGS